MWWNYLALGSIVLLAAFGTCLLVRYLTVVDVLERFGDLVRAASGETTHFADYEGSFQYLRNLETRSPRLWAYVLPKITGLADYGKLLSACQRKEAERLKLILEGNSGHVLADREVARHLSRLLTLQDKGAITFREWHQLRQTWGGRVGQIVSAAA